MRNKNAYPIYLLALLGILLLSGCMTLKTVEVEELKNQGKIHVVALDDGTYYQIHSNRQVKSVVEDDQLVLQQNEGNTNIRIPLAEVDYCDVFSFSAMKTGCSIALACTTVVIYLFW